jgi:hypothetical protein
MHGYRASRQASVMAVRRRSIVLIWLGLVLAGCTSHVRSTPCLAQWEATLCGPCGAPSALADTEREAVIARLTAALLEAEVDRGFLTSDAPLSATETRFYRTSSGPLATVTSKGLRFAPAEATARAYARGRPHHPVTFIDVTSAEVSGSDALYVKVLVVDETWMGEARGHLNERIPAEYCVTVNGDEIEIRTVLAPTHIAASEAWPVPAGSAAHRVGHPRRSFR